MFKGSETPSIDFSYNLPTLAFLIYSLMTGAFKLFSSQIVIKAFQELDIKAEDLAKVNDGKQFIVELIRLVARILPKN